MSDIQEIQIVKPIIDLLNQYFPCTKQINVITGRSNELWDFFTAYKEGKIWKIVCVDYWIWIDEDFLSIKPHLLDISKEQNVDIEFKWDYIITQKLKRKQILHNKLIFLGKLNRT